MIACPWCGTNYVTFQPNCKNCGGALQAVEETNHLSVSTENIPTPPPAPRSISKNYVWRLLSSDGWSIAAFVFGLLGGIFSLVGAVLTIAIITAFVGIPFLLLGLAFLASSGGILNWRYQEMQKVVNILRIGEATSGEIVEVQENYSVRINGRHPWVIRYQFQVNGQNYEGKISTLNPVAGKLQAGKTVCILYLPTSPQWNSIYPRP
jgi:hypothetical protein